jgi:AraC-like DNA-binding protein
VLRAFVIRGILCLLVYAGFAAGDSASVTHDSAPAETVVSDTVTVPSPAAAPAETLTDRSAAKARVPPPRPKLTSRDSLLNAVLSSAGGIQTDTAETTGSAAPAAGPRKAIRYAQKVVSMYLHHIKGHPVAALSIIIGSVLLLIVWLFLHRLRTKKDERRFMTTTRLSLMNGEVQRACLHIEKNYSNPALTPASVCGAIVTGQPFLETMFERELGMDVAAYIDQVRIHHARQFVQWNECADAPFVAAHVGFESAAEFDKHFKMVTGSDFKTFRTDKQKSSDGGAS